MKKRRISLLFLITLVTACSPEKPSARMLPDSDSPGALLVTGYCTECHGAPLPSSHSAKEWAGVVRRMQNWRVTKGFGVISEKDEKPLLEYLERHGRAE